MVAFYIFQQDVSQPFLSRMCLNPFPGLMIYIYIYIYIYILLMIRLRAATNVLSLTILTSLYLCGIGHSVVNWKFYHIYITSFILTQWKFKKFIVFKAHETDKHAGIYICMSYLREFVESLEKGSCIYPYVGVEHIYNKYKFASCHKN